MTDPGRDAEVVLDDGRVLEYWDGGDPAGRPVLYHPGTPVTRVLGRWGHEAARAAGARLIALNRPGYGGSTPIHGPPSLRAVGVDTVALATQLGIDEFAVFGASGGGPYAVATALAASGAVRALGIVGGTGPWRLIEAPDYGQEDRACLAILDAGDTAGARACLAAQVEAERSHLSPEQFYEAVVSDDSSPVVGEPAYRALWVASSQSVLEQPAGYIDDNLAWGGPWDVDPRDVVTPCLLWYGTADTRCSHHGHGRWYAERMPHAELIELPGATHFDVIDAHWPDVLAGLLRIWA